MKSRILACVAAALIMIASAPAFANSCPRHMKAIDAALKTTTMPADKVAKATALRAEGEAYHNAGQHIESVAALTEAKKILGIK